MLTVLERNCFFPNESDDNKFIQTMWIFYISNPSITTRFNRGRRIAIFWMQCTVCARAGLAFNTQIEGDVRSLLVCVSKRGRTGFSRLVHHQFEFERCLVVAAAQTESLSTRRGLRYFRGHSFERNSFPRGSLDVQSIRLVKFKMLHWRKWELK